jgi:hypothetical protein
MLGKQGDVDVLILARMKELADGRTPWHRGLWQPGTIVLLSEVEEAVQATWAGSLTKPDAMKDIIDVAQRQLSRDPGLGGSDVQQSIVELLTKLKPVGNASAKATPELQRALDRVSAYIDRCRTGYMLRWIEHVDAKKISPDEVELAARLIVSHLLDEGFHRSHIHGWLTKLPVEWTLSQALTRAREMLLQETREFTFVVSIAKAPGEVGDAFGEKWLPGEDFLEAFRGAVNSKQFAVPRLGAGAIEWSCTRRDPHAALAELLAWQERILARAQLGYGNSDRIEFGLEVVDKNTNRIRTPRSELRPIRVSAIQRGRFYGMSSTFSPQLDGAIGLLASHSSSAAGPSIASVWAAAEGLLGRPGGKGVEVADHLADIVACSFPRAELGHLAKVWADEGGEDVFATLLRSLSSAEQARLMSENILSGPGPAFSGAADRAAVARYRQLAADPQAVLARVRSYYSSVFRRLYYQRNFIMHAAKFDSVTLGVSIRTSPVLVAAALDRIVNAQNGDPDIGPLDVAARAENELSLLGKPGARPVYELLAS